VPALALWDVDDAAAFCSAIVTRSGLQLSWADREDLEQQLLVTWELSLKFEPGQGSVGFSSYAGTILRHRTSDWVRQRKGRTIWKFKGGRVHERKLPSFVSIDDQLDADPVGNALGSDGGDAPTDWLTDDGGLYRDRDSLRARDLETLGHGEA
jgi:DNA-directed RNA polymerase specialized sigma24 family protein